MRHALPLFLTVLFLALIWWIDLPRTLGAHPFWSRDAVLLGGGLGLALGSLSVKFPWVARLIVFVLIAALGYGLAIYGKTAFAASFGEDALAGRFWFIGWHAALAGFSATLLTLIARGVRRVPA